MNWKRQASRREIPSVCTDLTLTIINKFIQTEDIKI